MRKALSSAAVAGLLCVLALPLQAGEAAARAGAQRATTGATDAVMSPVRLVEGVQQDTAQHGAVGVVTGTVKGGARAVGQLVTGAANVGVGVVEVLVSPFSR